MNKELLSKIAAKGIKIAKQCEGDWIARFALGMKQAWKEHKAPSKEEIEKMENVNGLIKKFKIELGMKNGIEGIKVFKKPSSAEVKELKKLKPTIIEELKATEDNKREKAIEAMKRGELKRKAYKKEYLATHLLERCLVCYHYETSIEWSIETLDVTKEIAYKADYVTGRIELPQMTNKMNEVSNRKNVQFGMAGIAYVISTEEEKEIIAEQIVAQIKADEKAEFEKIEEEKRIAEIKKAKEEKIEATFGKAKETGKKQLIGSWSTECCDPTEQCDVDMHYQWAMPDGTTERTWTHTW